MVYRNDPVEISIVIPVYNSEQTLSLLVQKIEEVLLPAGISFELILVDDKSTDHSWKRIEELAQTRPFLKGIKLSENMGQFEALLTGIKNASGAYIVNMDDDLEHPVHEILNLYERLKQSAELRVVFGLDADKYLQKGENHSLQYLRNQFLNIFWNKYPTDSFRIFRRDIVFDGDTFLVNVPLLEIFFKHHVSRKQIDYVDVRFSPRVAGASGYSTLKKLRLFFRFTPYFSSLKAYISCGFLSLLLLYLCSCFSMVDTGICIVAGAVILLLLIYTFKTSREYRLPVRIETKLNL